MAGEISNNDKPKVSEIRLRAVELIDQSDVEVENGEFNSALSLLGKAAFLCPNFATIYYKRAEIYAQSCDFKSALVNFRKAFHLSPEDHNTKFRYAAALDVQGQLFMDNLDFDTAITYFTQAIDLNGLEANFWLHRALCYVQRKQWRKAVRDADHCILLNSSSADIYILRAKLRWMMGSTGTGNDDFARAQRLDPEHPEVKIYEDMLWNKVEEVYAEASQCLLRKEYPSAKRLLSNGLELNPADIKVRVLRAATNRFMKNFDEALADLEHAAQVFSEQNQTEQVHAEIIRQQNLTFNDMAVESFKKRDFHRAITLFNRVIESENFGEVSAVVAREGVSAVNMAFYRNRGDCYRHCGQIPQALADYHVAYDMNPNDWEIRTRLSLVHHTLGSELFNKKSYDEAEIEFSTAIQYNPKVGHFFLHRGNALYLQQKFEDAYSDFEKAMELNPQLTEAGERLSQFRNLEKRQEAKRHRSKDRVSLPKLGKSFSQTLITEQTARPIVPKLVKIARQREIKANKDLYNIWEIPDTSHLLKDPLLILMANGGKGPTKLRNEHKHKPKTQNKSKTTIKNMSTKSKSTSMIRSKTKK
jgi:tetratricopeptide (TPR) repeat protein